MKSLVSLARSLVRKRKETCELFEMKRRDEWTDTHTFIRIYIVRYIYRILQSKISAYRLGNVDTAAAATTNMIFRLCHSWAASCFQMFNTFCNEKQIHITFDAIVRRLFGLHSV